MHSKATLRLYTGNFCQQYIDIYIYIYISTIQFFVTIKHNYNVHSYMYHSFLQGFKLLYDHIINCKSNV